MFERIRRLMKSGWGEVPPGGGSCYINTVLEVSESIPLECLLSPVALSSFIDFTGGKKCSHGLDMRRLSYPEITTEWEDIRKSRHMTPPPGKLQKKKGITSYSAPSRVLPPRQEIRLFQAELLSFRESVTPEPEATLLSSEKPHSPPRSVRNHPPKAFFSALLIHSFTQKLFH